MRLEDILSVTVSFGGRDRSLLGLIDSWAGHVLTLADSIDEPAANDWTVYDFIAALHIRDAVQAGVNPKLPGRLPSALEIADRLFRSLTVDDVDSSLNYADPELPVVQHWWWGRKMKGGPIASELNAMVEKATGSE